MRFRLRFREVVWQGTLLAEWTFTGVYWRDAADLVLSCCWTYCDAMFVMVLAVVEDRISSTAIVVASPSFDAGSLALLMR